MRNYMVFLALFFMLLSCKSVPEKVKADKEKFIQIAKESSKPIDLNNQADLLEQVKSNNVEGKMKYLGVSNIQAVYELGYSNEFDLDSIVIFTKSNYRIIYDFATIVRQIETVKQTCNLKNLEQIDDRLYIGQK